jgi:predicted DNA-binding transcriptional regulator AlpA
VQTYDFTLKFSLDSEATHPERFVEPLAEAGCDDALIGIGQEGRIAFNFTREATSAFDAIASAIRDVKKVIPTAKLIEATPDFVGLTDVAELLGVSRQYMRKLMMSDSTFPYPVHEGKPALWHLATILQWLKSCKAYPIKDDLIEIAETNRQFNITKELVNMELSQHDNIRALIA